MKYSTYPILLVHPYPWPMRTVAETGLTQTALAAAALKRSLCRRRRRTPSGRSPTRGSSSTRRVSLLADEEKLPWQENEVTIQGAWRPSASFGKISGGEKALQQCWCSRHRAIHLFLPDWPRGVLLQQTEPGQLAFTHRLCPAPVYIVIVSRPRGEGSGFAGGME